MLSEASTLFIHHVGQVTNPIRRNANVHSRIFAGSKRTVLAEVDDALIDRLELLTSNNPDYWTFPKGAAPRDAHAFFRYPAMMVPSMQRELIRVVTDLQPNIESVLEPFVGSGTVMVESILAGRSVRAQDINPLAILLCKAKAGPFRPAALADYADDINQLIKMDRGRKIDIEFDNRRKWFTARASMGLSKIRRAILTIEDRSARRFFWVALAETVRNTSNSRTSTYKLHIRPREEIERLPDPISVYQSIVQVNLNRFANYTEQLQKAGILVRSRCNVKIDIRLIDSRKAIKGSYDLLVTSPPYGDNRTTVPYGQSAYLPLQWIPLEDIEENVDTDNLKSIYEIDKRSLGGVLPPAHENLLKSYEELLDRSSALRATLCQLVNEPRDRSSRILSFIHDLDCTAKSCFSALRRNAYSIVTLGNRRVGGIEVPLHEILPQLMATYGAHHVYTFERRIPSKRMAVRNQFADTMRGERVIILRKQHEGNI